MCEADSTTCTESDSTVCYEESDSDNDSLSSGPMFVEDTYDTDKDDDDGLPHIELAEVGGAGHVVDGVAAAVAAAAAAALDPDGHPMHSDCDKCKCAEDDEKKVFFLICILFLFLKPNK